MTEHAKLDKYIKSLELEYSAVFVPFSKSRNAKDTKEIKQLSDYSLNWKVTIKSTSGSIENDYMQGIGNLPEVIKDDIKGFRNTIYNHEVVKSVCEIGKYTTNWKVAKLSPPLLRDALWCLLMDSEAID